MWVLGSGALGYRCQILSTVLWHYVLYRHKVKEVRKARFWSLKSWVFLTILYCVICVCIKYTIICVLVNLFKLIIRTEVTVFWTWLAGVLQCTFIYTYLRKLNHWFHLFTHSDITFISQWVLPGCLSTSCLLFVGQLLLLL